MTILIAEDDRSSRMMLESMLKRWGYEVLSVDNGEDALNHLSQQDSAQLAILDWMLPVMDGIDVCRKIRKKEKAIDHNLLGNAGLAEDLPKTYTYIILLTAKTTQEDKIVGFEAGIDDYVSKPFNAEELQARIRVGLRILDLQNQLLATQQELKKMAQVDYLTQIFNRRAIITALKKEILRAKREKLPLSVAMLDIDHFKQINDNHGHQKGDLVLKECVQRIKGVLRDYDQVGRFGGEEFLLILPHATGEQALAICQRIKDSIANTPFLAGSIEIPCTVSLGVTDMHLSCHFKKSEKNDESQISSVIDCLIRAADKALYLAKNKGRNRVTLLTQAQHKSATQTDLNSN